MKNTRITLMKLHTLGHHLLNEDLDLTLNAEQQWAPDEPRHWCVEAQRLRAQLLRTELSDLSLSGLSGNTIANVLEKGLANGSIPSILASPLYIRRARACLFSSFFELITEGQYKIATFRMEDTHWHLPNHLWEGVWLKPAQYFRQSINRQLNAAGLFGGCGFLLANLTGSLSVNQMAIRLELRGIMSESKIKMVHALPKYIRNRIHIGECGITPNRLKQYQLCKEIMPIRIREDPRYIKLMVDPRSLWKHRRFCEALYLLWLANNELQHMLVSDGLEIHNGRLKLADGYTVH